MSRHLLPLLFIFIIAYVSANNDRQRNTADINKNISPEDSPINRKSNNNWTRSTDGGKALEDFKDWKQKFEEQTGEILINVRNEILDDLEILRQEFENNQSQLSRAKTSARITLNETTRCSDSITGISNWLNKLQEEIDDIKSKLVPWESQSYWEWSYIPWGWHKKYRNVSRPIPPPSYTLSKIQVLSSRLNSAELELLTETQNKCSESLKLKIANMMRNIESIRIEESSRLTNEAINLSCKEIVNGRFAVVKDQLTEAAGIDNTFNTTLVLEEILYKTLSVDFDQRFYVILKFLKTLDTSLFKSGMESLLRFIDYNNYIDSMQFLRIAYESKSAFGYELKEHFPVNIQQLFWSGTTCIRNKLTNSYLESRNPKNIAQQDTNTLNVRAVKKPERITDENTGKVISTKCDWEFYPLAEADSLHFIIQQKISSNSRWNLKVHDSKKTLHVNPSNANPLTWEILPRDIGHSFAISTSSFNSKIFICSTTEMNRGNVTIAPIDKFRIESYQNCKWYLEDITTEV